MGLLDELERKYRGFAIPNITLYIVLGQVFLYIAAWTGTLDLGRAVLVPRLVLEGELWRVITFLFIPPLSNPFFAFFAWYLFYLMGTALENSWGAFRYNAFLLIGWFATAALSFLAPAFPATNLFLGGSVFLAFATLFPDFEILIFFILPVKIKWLALITWLGYAWQFLAGSWMTRLLVVASLSNYLLFFGKDIALRVRSGRMRMASQAREIARSAQAFHVCSVCGRTDQTDPDMEFRYCPECDGKGYCSEHINNHEHGKKKT